MFPYETNSYSKSDSGISQTFHQASNQAFHQASTDSAPVQRVALQSDESSPGDAGQLLSRAEVRQTSEQQELPAPVVKPTPFHTSPLVWLLPIWGAIVWLLLLGTASEAWKLLRYNATTLKQGQRVPCKNCQFFSSNFYLKCAVRPSDALTDRAVDCTDFCQKSAIEESKPQAKGGIRR